MERAGSPPVVLPYTPTPPMPLAVLPTPDPSPLPALVGLTTPSTPAAVPDSVPAKVERARSHASLISEEAGSATPIGTLPSSPLSYCTEPQDVHPPTNHPIQHCAWQCELEAIMYFADCGTGKAAPLFRCDICKGRDHSSILCLFPSNTMTIFQNLGAQADAALASGLGDCREAVHINFNYFMCM